LPAKPINFKDKALEGIFESAKICNLKPEELMDYEIEKKRFSDYAAALDFAKEKGIEIGETRSETRGMKKLIALLRQGYSLDEAERKLGLA
jgi:hypothetical protein